MTVTPAQHARALARGAWQCPACPLGFMQFDITADLNLCPNCGYHGGEAHAGPGVVEIEVPVAEWLKGSPSREVMQQIVQDMFPALPPDVTHVKVRLSLCPTLPPNMIT
jgi:hypothetical protein